MSFCVATKHSQSNVGADTHGNGHSSCLGDQGDARKRNPARQADAEKRANIEMVALALLSSQMTR